MLTKKLPIALIVILMVLALASRSEADISNAAVLFLRIAPGARAAGMGEAFVAVADDATATHWNPAGLGAYPLSEIWMEVKVPSHLRPLKAMAALKQEGGGGYRAYDIWAITSQGLVRYDHRRWHSGEVFSTKTDQTVEKIVKSYFNVTDEDRLARMVETVAAANNPRSLAYLEELRDGVMALIPEDYSALESLTSGFDSLLAGYECCLINWGKVREAERRLSEGMKDSALTEMECDRINFAVERSRNRFIPEELVIPYSTLFDTEPAAIASTEKALLVGTANGLFSYNGKRWQTLTDSEALPSTNILCLFALPTGIYIGTDSGLARFPGLEVRPVDGVEQLPRGAVTAIGAGGHNNVWIVLNNDLYHWDGKDWSNSLEYTVALDDTPERIAEKLAVYGTALEEEKYLAKFHQLNQNLSASGSGEETPQMVTDSSQTPSDDAGAVPGEPTSEEDSAGVIVTPEAESPVEETLHPEEAGHETGPAGSPTGLTPGMVVRAPFLAEIKGKVNSIHVSFDKIWLGTEYGVMLFNRDRWVLPGCREHEVKEGQTLDSLVQMKAHKDFVSALRYAAVICDVNDLEYELHEPLADDQVVKVYRNPAAAPVNRISGRLRQVYFATSEGLLEYDGTAWARVDQKGLGRATVVYVDVIEDGLVLASDRKIVIKANGRAEIALEHAKWLPELASDLYYEFLCFAAPAGSWGTLGGNVTFMSYGTFVRTGEGGPASLGTWDSFDIAFTGSYGTSLSGKLKGGISAKVIYSRLTTQGAGKELGEGTSTGFAVDLGLLYQMTPRLNWGLAVTNLGPKMAYIDAGQADPLPRNLAFGFAYNLLQSDYYRLLIAAQVNKMLVGLGDGFREELKQVTLHGGAEFLYANTIAFRGGYVHDEEGNLKSFTAGVGLYLLNTLRFDFAYYFASSENESRKGTKPITIAVAIR